MRDLNLPATKTGFVRALVATERERLGELLEWHRAELVLAGSAAVANLRAVIEDPSHPRNVEVSRWLIDKLLPARSEGPAVNVQIGGVPADLAAEIRDNVAQLREAISAVPPLEESPHLLEGKDALPAAYRARHPDEVRRR